MDNTRLLLQKQFSTYTKDSIIGLLSSLNVLPENHTQRIRLTTALQAAIDMEEAPDAYPIHPAALEKILADTLIPGTDAWNKEDPAEILFTEVFLFHGGNYILFPEVFADSHLGLKHLADTIFMTENNFPKDFKEDIFFAMNALLMMSNSVAETMGYPRYMISPEGHHAPVFFPEGAVQAQATKAIRFNYNFVLKPGLTGIAERAAIIKRFTSEQRPAVIAQNEEIEFPVLTKPLYRSGEDLLLSNIQAIPAALVHFILVKIREYQILDAFLIEYRQVLQQRTRELLKRIDFDEIDEMPAVSKSHPLSELELFYRFDHDKLAWVTLIPDLFQSYNSERFFTRENIFIPASDLARRRGTIKEYVGNHYPEHELLFIDLFVPVGREYLVSGRQTESNHLHLSYADLKYIVLHDSGSDGLDFWRYVLATRAYLVHGQIQAFAFLDKFAFYKDHHNSFYVDDDLRYPSLIIPIGYANKFREEAHSKTDAHLVRLANGLLEVERRFHHREIDIYIPNNPEFLPRQYIMGTPVSFWVHVQFQQRNNPIIRQTAWMLMESCSYWLWEAGEALQKPFVGQRERIVPFEIKLLDEENWNSYNFDKTQTTEIVSKLFRTEAKSTHITVYVPFEFAYLINGVNNENDRVILHWLVVGLNNYLIHEQIAKPLNVDEIVACYAPKGKKTMTQGFDTIKNPVLHPHRLPERRFVEDFEIESLLNDLAIKAAPQYSVGEIEDIKEKNKVCNLVVKYYFDELKTLIAEFPFHSLLRYVVALNESLWRLKHMTGNKTTSRLACFGRVASMRAEIIDENMEIEEATLALRCLIEIIVAIPPSGKKVVNNRDFDQMLALTKEIVTWGTISDELNFGVNEVSMGILPSGRIGIGKEFLNQALRPYNRAKKDEAIDERILAEEERATRVEIADTTSATVVDTVKESVWEAEFGFSWTTFLDMLMTLVDLGYDTEDGVVIHEQNHLINLIQARYTLSDETINSFFDQFSLSSRGKWENLPSGYRLADIYPWRYSRPLSLMRKPIIKVEADGRTYYHWGMRQALLSYQYIDDLIADGRYNSRSAEMKSYVSGLLDKKGKKFTRDVFIWLSANAPAGRYKIDREVKISETGKLKADKNYGDIDILLIDLLRKKIISVECKHITPARITSEFASELKKFEAEWIGKHTKRHKWLTSHLAEIKVAYQLDEAEPFEVKSIFLTSEKVPFPFITKAYKNLPFFDFSSWTRDSSIINDI